MPLPTVIPVIRAGVTRQIPASDYVAWLLAGWQIDLPPATPSIIKPIVGDQVDIFWQQETKIVHRVDLENWLRKGWSQIPPVPPTVDNPQQPDPYAYWRRMAELYRLWRDKGTEAITAIAQEYDIKINDKDDFDVMTIIEQILEYEKLSQ